MDRSWGAFVVAATWVAIVASGCSGGDSSVPAPVAADEAGLSKLELIGKRIFFDTSLSEPSGQACASCHDPLTAFSGNFGSTAGVPFAADKATLGLRNTPTAMYASFTPAFSIVGDGPGRLVRGGQFLDGRAASLEEQARAPFFAAGEMNLVNEAELMARIANAEYSSLVLEEFGYDAFSEPKRLVDFATRAIAAFERSPRFAPFSSKYDNALAGAAVLSELEAEGLRLFADPKSGNCAKCHGFKAVPRDASESLFTDFSYHNIGVPRNPRIPANADPAFFDLGLCGPRRERLADDGLCGAFKTPTLRNVALRKAFMHNGFFTDLREAVAFYATRDTTPARWYAAGTYLDDVPAAYRANVDLNLVPFRPSAAAPAGLSEHDIDALTAFLETLNDGYGPSRIPGLK